ncbi:HIRAN domain-containing protein [Pseudoclavibacter helvolus]|uniref:HIRAN domain-containing protein n=1 Tax=Pseudoclavibacter helvolus TaxID=255205 RepID=UPI000839851C|nr:HIRAN domain-containing protein [Pseudoclavibacter helvolus]
MMLSIASTDASKRAASAGATRELLLIWQNPKNRKFRVAGLLTYSADEGYSFRYQPTIASDPDFFPLAEYPDLEHEYVASHLPPFFANRVMSTRRGSYPQYLDWMGLDVNAANLPIELLVRTGASKATDTFHIVEKPARSATTFTSRFFVSGIRHQPGAEVTIEDIKSGEELQLQPEPDNPKNPDAHMVLRSHDERIGWVPDWLCGEVAAMAAEGWSYRVIAEQVNPSAPAHIRVLCRLEAVRFER